MECAEYSDLTPLVVEIGGRKSLLKPPFSTRLRSGSVILQPGEDVGVHRTDGREEAIVLLKGEAVLICEGEEFTIRANQMAYVPPAREHNVVNRSDQPVEYVYVVAPVGDNQELHDHGSGAHTH